jgi:hypothetical protein
VLGIHARTVYKIVSILPRDAPERALQIDAARGVGMARPGSDDALRGNFAVAAEE